MCRPQFRRGLVCRPLFRNGSVCRPLFRKDCCAKSKQKVTQVVSLTKNSANSPGISTNFNFIPGYLISKRQLNNNDDAGLETLVNVSSIEQLAAAKAESHTFSDLLRGSVSFGASMKRTGLDAVPSPVNRSPGRAGYYSGGYITKTYKARIDAIQIEIHYYHRRRASRRRNYAKALARAIVEFYDQHYL